MRTEIYYWIVTAPLGIALIMGMLSEFIGTSETVTEIIGLLLFVTYVLSLVKIVVILAKNPTKECSEFFEANGFTTKRSRYFGRRYMGQWHTVPVEVRCLVGAGGLPTQLDARSPSESTWLADSLAPVAPDEISTWLDRISGRNDSATEE
jgi:hypothetical protein